MSKVMHRTAIPNLATVVAGDGGYLIDKQGNRFLDACGGAAGLATQLEIRERKLLSNVRVQGGSIVQQLKQRFSATPEIDQYIGDIRGRGLFIGIELVENKETKQPFDAKLTLHAKIKKQAMEEFLMIYPMGGTIDGVRGDHILLAPPFIINEDDVSQIVERLIKTLHSVLKSCKSGGVYSS